MSIFRLSKNWLERIVLWAPEPAQQKFGDPFIKQCTLDLFLFFEINFYDFLQCAAAQNNLDSGLYISDSQETGVLVLEYNNVVLGRLLALGLSTYNSRVLVLQQNSCVKSG